MQFSAAAMAACCRSFFRHCDLLACPAMPCRNAMPPPELARDAPVVNVPHPLEVGFCVLFRREPDIALLDGSDGFICEGLNLYEPLCRKARFHHALATVALADGVNVVFRAYQQALRLKVGENSLARRIAVQTCVCAALGVNLRRLIHHIDGGQSMPLTERKVIGIVRRRNLYCA